MSNSKTPETLEHVDDEQPVNVINEQCETAMQETAPATRRVPVVAIKYRKRHQSGDGDRKFVKEDWRDWNRKRAELDHEQGATDGRTWAVKAHPNELRLFVRYFKKWKKPFSEGDSPLWKRLLTSLPDFKARGELYSRHFERQVFDEYNRIKMLWAYLNYSAGLADGESWARETESAEKLNRLKANDRRGGWGFHPETYEDFDPDDSPARAFVVCISWAEPNDKDEEEECPRPEINFEKDVLGFWRRFVSEPLDDIACRLLVPEYVLGFGDGALGSGRRLQAQFLPSKEISATSTTDTELPQTGE
jgi:hypothetical protein